MQLKVMNLNNFDLKSNINLSFLQAHFIILTVSKSRKSKFSTDKKYNIKMTRYTKLNFCL